MRLRYAARGGQSSRPKEPTGASPGYFGVDKTIPLAELRKNKASGLNGGRNTLIHRKNTPRLPNNVEHVASAVRSNSPVNIRNVLGFRSSAVLGPTRRGISTKLLVN